MITHFSLWNCTKIFCYNIFLCYMVCDQLQKNIWWIKQKINLLYFILGFTTFNCWSAWKQNVFLSYYYFICLYDCLYNYKSITCRYWHSNSPFCYSGCMYKQSKIKRSVNTSERFNFLYSSKVSCSEQVKCSGGLFVWLISMPDWSLWLISLIVWLVSMSEWSLCLIRFWHTLGLLASCLCMFSPSHSDP